MRRRVAVEWVALAVVLGLCLAAVLLLRAAEKSAPAAGIEKGFSDVPAWVRRAVEEG